jgi:hypothetical protein
MATRVLLVGAFPLAHAAIRFDAERPNTMEVFNPHNHVTREVPIQSVCELVDCDIVDAAAQAIANQKRWVEFQAEKTRQRRRPC